MMVNPIKTRALLPPKDDLPAVLEESLPVLSERCVIAIASKVVAIWQGRTEAVPQGVSSKNHRELLAKREADAYLERDFTYPYARLFTIFDGVLGSVAGIDESNGNGWLTLSPKDADKAANDIRTRIQRQQGVEELGVIIVDSRGRPMRNGVTGIALGHAGFNALFDYRGTKDIFGRVIESERLNVADCLAATAALALGEGDEQTPIVVMEDVPHVVFSEKEVTDPMLTKTVSMEADVFARFFKDQPWKPGEGG